MVTFHTTCSLKCTFFYLSFLDTQRILSLIHASVKMMRIKMEMKICVLCSDDGEISILDSFFKYKTTRYRRATKFSVNPSALSAGSFAAGHCVSLHRRVNAAKKSAGTVRLEREGAGDERGRETDGRKSVRKKCLRLGHQKLFQGDDSPRSTPARKGSPLPPPTPTFPPLSRFASRKSTAFR